MSSFEQSAGIGAAPDPRGTSGTEADSHVLIDRPAARALACVLEDIAARLDSARGLLLEHAGHAEHDSPATWGALALVNEAGSLADRATQALGGFPINGSAAAWQLGRASFDALAMLEAGAPSKGGDA